MLVELYGDAGGDGWLNSSRWLEGEPCSDGWYGVRCCPSTAPYLTRDLTSCSESCEGGGSNVPLIGAPGSLQPRCAAEGDDTCVVVSLVLPSNGLDVQDGSLPTALASLQYLRHIDVSGNGLGGAAPDVGAASQCGGRSLSIKLGGNNFDYGGREGEAALAALLARCRGADCGAGLPPVSCDAFGPTWQVRLEQPTRCTDCSIRNVAGPVVLIVLIVGVAVALLWLYVRLVTRHPSAMRKGISTVSLVFTQVVTLTLIVGNLQLAWPPSIKATVELISLDFLNLQTLVKAECVAAAAGATSNSYFAIQTLRFSVILTLLLGISCQKAVAARGGSRPLSLRPWRPLGSMLQRDTSDDAPAKASAAVTTATSPCATSNELPLSAAAEAEAAAAAAAMSREQLADRLELRQQLVYQFQLVMSCRFSIDAFSYHDHFHALAAAATSQLLAALLLLVNAALAAKYYLHVRALVFGGATAWGAVAWRGGCELHIEPLSSERLARRLLYLTRRFSESAPFWQFAIWGRQLLLLLVALIPKWYSRSSLALLYGDGGGNGGGDGQDRASGGGDDDPGAEGEGEGDEGSGSGRGSDDGSALLYDDGYRDVVVAHAALAIVVFALSLALHARVRPYAFVFQNQVESGLLGCNALTVALGAAYTFAPERRAALEGVLLLILFGSWGGAAAFIWWVSFKERSLQKPPQPAEAGDLPRSLTWAFTPRRAASRRGLAGLPEEDMATSGPKLEYKVPSQPSMPQLLMATKSRRVVDAPGDDDKGVAHSVLAVSASSEQLLTPPPLPLAMVAAASVDNRSGSGEDRLPPPLPQMPPPIPPRLPGASQRPPPLPASFLELQQLRTSETGQVQVAPVPPPLPGSPMRGMAQRRSSIRSSNPEERNSLVSTQI